MCYDNRKKEYHFPVRNLDQDFYRCKSQKRYSSKSIFLFLNRFLQLQLNNLHPSLYLWKITSYCCFSATELYHFGVKDIVYLNKYSDIKILWKNNFYSLLSVQWFLKIYIEGYDDALMPHAHSPVILYTKYMVQNYPFHQICTIYF